MAATAFKRLAALRTMPLLPGVLRVPSLIELGCSALARLHLPPGMPLGFRSSPQVSVAARFFTAGQVSGRWLRA